MPSNRTDCGFTLPQAACQAKGCCYDTQAQGSYRCFFPAPDTCSKIPPASRTDCGFDLPQAACVAKGCCYDATTPGTYRCFNKSPGPGPGPPPGPGGSYKVGGAGADFPAPPAGFKLASLADLKSPGFIAAYNKGLPDNGESMMGCCVFKIAEGYLTVGAGGPTPPPGPPAPPPPPPPGTRNPDPCC